MEGGGVKHSLQWDDGYCLECNAPARGSMLGVVVRCPICGESWKWCSDRAMDNWQRLADRLLTRVSFVVFEAARNHCQELARAKAEGFPSGWIQHWPLACARRRDLWPPAISAHGTLAHGIRIENPVPHKLSAHFDVLACEFSGKDVHDRIVSKQSKDI